MTLTQPSPFNKKGEGYLRDEGHLPSSFDYAQDKLLEHLPCHNQNRVEPLIDLKN